MDSGTGEPFSDVDRVILEAATGARWLTADELRWVLERVAQTGFDPAALERVRGRLDGVVWQGRTLRGSDRLPPAEVKYAWHVVRQQEWPAGTGLIDYVESIRRVILDPTSGVFVGRYQRAWQLSMVRDSGDLRGPGGGDWILIEYRVDTGHWVTAYQPRVSLERALANPAREDVRWLRRQRPAAG
jgi:hypothetical protein